MMKDSINSVAPANTVPTTWLNKDILQTTASIEKVPDDLVGLGDDIREVAKKVYGEWIAINWHGSIPRGDFVFAESDADFTIITKNALPEGHQKVRKSLLDEVAPEWAERGVAKLDVIAVPLEELHEAFRRNVLFFCFSDGINLEGSQDLDLSFVLPDTVLDLVQLLNKKYALWLKAAEEEGNEDPLLVEQLRKRTIRAIYAKAMLQGAPYVRGWRTYGKNLAKYAVQYSDLYSRLIENTIDFTELVSSAEMVRADLEKSGITFDTTW